MTTTKQGQINRLKQLRYDFVSAVEKIKDVNSDTYAIVIAARQIVSSEEEKNEILHQMAESQ
jgi:hypothetical protein